MTSTPHQVRSSGQTQAEEITKEISDEFDADMAIEGPEDSPRDLFRTPGFHRMRLDWRGEDQRILHDVRSRVEDRLVATFRDAYEIMNHLYEVVRTPAQLDDRGEPVRDHFGFIVWKKLPNGDFEEDWSRLNRKEREDFLFRITTRLFDWEQRQVDAWGEAMFARAQWEERFAIDYNAPTRGTIEDRTSKARTGAAEERYFAIYVTLFSRKAEALVRSMNTTALRLKDTLV